MDKKVFQLCESCKEEDVKEYFGKNYLANIKFDGTRIMACVIKGDVVLMNRDGRICNKQFAELVEELKTLKDCIIDGEIISIDDNFEKLQKRALTRDKEKIKKLQIEVPIKYEVFDILKFEGKEITGLDLTERIEFLKKLFDKTNFKFIELAEYGEVKDMYEKAKKEDREGIIIKRKDGDYQNRRSSYWLKCKFFLETQLEVIKYEENPKGIRAEDKDGNAVQISHSDFKKVKELIDKDGKAIILCQYLEKTAENRLRFPSFRGLVE